MAVGDVIDNERPLAVFRHTARDFLRNDSLSQTDFIGHQKASAPL